MEKRKTISSNNKQKAQQQTQPQLATMLLAALFCPLHFMDEFQENLREFFTNCSEFAEQQTEQTQKGRQRRTRKR